MKTITAIVETPKGKGQKYDFDPLLDCFKLKKVMPAGLSFPYDFGYIPGTTGGDGDPVDVMIISEIETFSGCAVDCRVIGAIKASQKEKDGRRMRNDRIIAVAEVSRQYVAVNKLTDLPKDTLGELENFFSNYNQQAGKVFTPLERLSPAKAVALIEKAQNEVMKDTLVQLLLPIVNGKGEPFPENLYARLNAVLKSRFGGFTVYSRSPVSGIWKDDQGKTKKDELLVYEVLIHSADSAYWTWLKTKLEKEFSQQEIQVLLSRIRKL